MKSKDFKQISETIRFACRKDFGYYLENRLGVWETSCQNVMWRVGHGGVGSEGQVRSLKKVTGFPVSR